MYFYAFFSQWCINITAQLLSVSNYIAVDKIIIGPFGPIVSYQSLGHVGGCLTNIHHFDYSPQLSSQLLPFYASFPSMSYSLKLVFSLLHTAFSSFTGYFIIVIVTLFCLPHFRITN